MALNIKSAEADRLARELARRRRLPMTQVIIDALRAELDRELKRARPAGLAQRLLDIGERHAARPDRDERTDDEILGYDYMTRGA